MKSHTILFVGILGLLGSAVPAVAMMRAPGSEVSPTQQKPQHETKSQAGKTQPPSRQNLPTVPLTVPVKQNR